MSYGCTIFLTIFKYSIITYAEFHQFIQSPESLLIFTTPCANAADNKLIIFFILLIFPRKQDSTFPANCLPMETICIKFQACFLRKIIKKKFHLLKFLPRALRVSSPAAKSRYDAFFNKIMLSFFLFLYKNLCSY